MFPGQAEEGDLTSRPDKEGSCRFDWRFGEGEALAAGSVSKGYPERFYM
jgi:hypothetical protein